MKLCIYEDAKWDSLYPLTMFRPAWELRLGYFLLWQKLYEACSQPDTHFFTRDYLVPTVQKRIPKGSAVNDSSVLKGNDIFYSVY